MGQVTIYLDDETETKLIAAAKSSQVSVSKWVATMFKGQAKTEWPQAIVDLAGSWQDGFPSLEEIRSDQGQDSLREKL